LHFDKWIYTPPARHVIQNWKFVRSLKREKVCLLLNLFLQHVESYIDYRLSFPMPHSFHFSHAIRIMWNPPFCYQCLLAKKNILNRHLVFDEASQSLWGYVSGSSSCFILVSYNRNSYGCAWKQNIVKRDNVMNRMVFESIQNQMTEA
jgi:hypothetical protein